MALFILAVILFIIADVVIRYVGKKMSDKKHMQEREVALKESLNLDYSLEAKTLKRAEIKDPKAKILCVDDEPVILDSFRKILVLDGYSIDTVENGKEALGLIQTHHYDFLFTDLKMPIMDGVDVVKSAKHMRPDIDVVIVTGYATVETAVECMKYGAMDYVQKPFTDDELTVFVNKLLIKRQDKIQKTLKPKVHITHLKEIESTKAGEFAIPGGVFISEGHCWAGVEENGSAKIGIDDFAKKLIGKIESIEFPNLGMVVAKGQNLFSAKQGNRVVAFNSPLSGKVTKVNKFLRENIEALEQNPYEENWVCAIDADNLDTELPSLKIGKAAVSFYHSEIDNFKSFIQKMPKAEKENAGINNGELFVGQLEKLDDKNWSIFVSEFFKK